MKTLLTLLFAVSLLSCARPKTADEGPIARSSSIGVSYKYNELMIKDYDEMLEMVQSFVNKAKSAAGEDGTANEDEVVGYLREALKLTFSRPDSDNMVAKLVPESRRMLLGFNNAYEGSVAVIAEEAIRNVKSRNTPASIQSTSLFILENIMGEITPEVPGNAQLRTVAQKIRDANLKVSDEVKKERKIRGMFSTKNPSDIARDILKGAEPEKKKKK
jgi:hypothetical protein